MLLPAQRRPQLFREANRAMLASQRAREELGRSRGAVMALREALRDVPRPPPLGAAQSRRACRGSALRAAGDKGRIDVNVQDIPMIAVAENLRAPRAFLIQGAPVSGCGAAGRRRFWCRRSQAASVVVAVR